MSTIEISREANGFLLTGKDCECDVDFRCANHDDAAEQAYWRGQIYGFVKSLPVVVVEENYLREAYEPGSPKAFDLDQH